MNVCEAWDNKGDIVIGNDVWIGFEDSIIEDLLKIQWWNWSIQKI